jgi:hypothetical protein
MICVVVLQNCMGFVDCETGYCSETCVTGDVDETEEFNIKVEDPLDIKDEIPQAVSFPEIESEHEVRLQGVCEVVAAHAFKPFFAPKRQ